MTERARKAMQLVVDWRKSHDLCMERTRCDESCPFFQGKHFTCNKYSTEQVLEMAAEAFHEELKGDQ